MQRGNKHYVKSVRIESFPGPYFPAFAVNTEISSVNLRIQSEGRKHGPEKFQIWTLFT